ncbi:hypothetical protein H8I91_09475 [Serratia fonticola]|uniref:hypothetical protein n=1 Tax=Serratia fonticola TaxID=47917 RepID=UPI0016441D16|nr:hypothetical protein [Serratia fonticola]MBC3250492.1 hypothetical protein [Serratia fonticola]
MNVLTYEQLKQRLDAVVAENAKAIAAVQTFADATEQLTEIIGDEIGMEGVANLLAAFSAVGNMPETTAALAEVEARAVEKFAAQQEEKSSAAERAWASHLGSAHQFAALQARAFAVELREGRV